MPTYATRTDLNRFFSTASINDWADKDRSGGELTAEELLAIDAVLDAAEAQIDGALRQGGYAAPFEGSTYAGLPGKTKALLRQWTVTIGGYLLYTWRGLQDRTNPFDTLHAQTQDALKAVGDGEPVAGLDKPASVRFGAGGDVGRLKGEAWDW